MTTDTVHRFNMEDTLYLRLAMETHLGPSIRMLPTVIRPYCVRIRSLFEIEQPLVPSTSVGSISIQYSPSTSAVEG